MEPTQKLELFLVAAVLGGLIGLERQFGKSDQRGAIVGIRTFCFISLLGAMSAMVADEKIYWFPAVAFIGLVSLVTIRYYLEATTGPLGITTEVTELLTFLVGALTYWGHLRVSIALAVGITLLLSLKPEMQKWAERVQAEDIRAIIKFAVISLVILPILRNQPVDPWGLFNPREVWMMVVLISAVSFTGYIMLKFAKVRGALELTGLFGGIVSSTAVALSYSRRSRELPFMSKHLALGILLAEIVMFPRLTLLVAVTGKNLLGALMIPFGAMTAVGLGFILYFWFRYRTRGKDEEVSEFRNPFEISTALTFGAVYAIVRIVAALGLKYYGQEGLYLAAFLSGIAETDAITLSIARMVRGAGSVTVDPRVGAIAVTIAAIMNTMFKGSLALFIATPSTRRPVVAAMLAIVIAGLISLYFI